MKGYLIRVGIDTTLRNIGYCAPVFSDNRFEYIPIPCFSRETSEEQTYGNMRARNKQYGQFLSDFMHTDRHSFLKRDGTPYVFSVDENGQPLLAKDIAPHFDPEFVAHTFGDARATSVGRRGRIPSDLDPGDYVFFYSGLAEYNQSFYQSERRWHDLRSFQIHNKCAFLIAYLKFRRIFDIRTEEDLTRYSSEIKNNAHFKEKRTDCAITKGDESKLVDKAIQLNYWDPERGKYSPTDIGKKIGLRSTSGMRVMKWLNEAVCRELLEIMNKYP